MTDAASAVGFPTSFPSFPAFEALAFFLEFLEEEEEVVVVEEGREGAEESEEQICWMRTRAWREVLNVEVCVMVKRVSLWVYNLSAARFIRRQLLSFLRYTNQEKERRKGKKREKERRKGKQGKRETRKRERKEEEG